MKLIDKTDTKVNFVSIEIPFTAFEEKFTELKNGDQIREYITIEEGE